VNNNIVEGNSLIEAVCRCINKRRESLGLSQEELAQRSGLHRTYVSDIERGARNPSLKTICRLAEGLGLTTAQLIQEAEQGLTLTAGST
jgi:transcriptional regulator with XRE-family HTH domain